MKLFEVNGTYGSNETPCTVFVAQKSNGLSWYCVEGSKNVNCTNEEITAGVNVEELYDVDMFTWPDGVHTLEELETAVEA